MSGDPGHYTERDLFNLRAVDVLQKPFLLGELISQLGRLMTPMEQRMESQEDR